MAAGNVLRSAAAIGALFAVALSGGLTGVPVPKTSLPTVVPCQAGQPPNFFLNPALIEMALRLFQQFLNVQFPLEAEREAAEALIDLAASGPDDSDTPEGDPAPSTPEKSETGEKKEKSLEATAARLIELVSDLLAEEKAQAKGRSEEETNEASLDSPEDLEGFVAKQKALRDKHEKTAEAYWLYAQLKKHVSNARESDTYSSKSS